MAKDSTNLLAFIGVFLTVIGFFIVYAVEKKNKYAMHYAKQGLILFVLLALSAVLISLVGWIPAFGIIIKTLLWIAWIALWIIGMVYSLSGKEQDIPIVGVYARMIKV